MNLGRNSLGGALCASADGVRVAGILAAAFALGSSPAAAQETDSASAQSQVLIQERTTIYRVDDMDFGEIATNGSPGTVVLSPAASGTCTASANLVRNGPCQPAAFSGYATPASFLRVRRPPGNALTLTGPGGATMQVTNLTYASDATLLELLSNATFVRFLVLANNGLYELRVGGTLNVGANQAAGTYSGTLEVLLNFN